MYRTHCDTRYFQQISFRIIITKKIRIAINAHSFTIILLKLITPYKSQFIL